MKRNINKRPLASLFGIIAIAVIIGLGMTGCPMEVGTTQLTQNQWKSDSLSQGGENWYKFTSPHTGYVYIYVYFGSLTDLYGQLYDSYDGNTIGGSTNFWSGSWDSDWWYLTAGQEYYLKVWPYSSYSGSYQITFSTSSSLPTR